LELAPSKVRGNRGKNDRTFCNNKSGRCLLFKTHRIEVGSKGPRRNEENRESNSPSGASGKNRKRRSIHHAAANNKKYRDLWGILRSLGRFCERRRGTI